MPTLIEDGQKLTRPRSAIYHHHNSLRPAGQRLIALRQLFNAVELTCIKWLFWIFSHLFVDVDIPRRTIASAPCAFFSCC